MSPGLTIVPVAFAGVSFTVSGVVGLTLSKTSKLKLTEGLAGVLTGHRQEIGPGL